MSIEKRLDALETDPEIRLALAMAGKLPVEELTDAELDVIRAFTHPDFQAVLDKISAVPGAWDYLDTDFGDMPADVRALYEELVEVDRRVHKGAKT